jgi:hypothetical protein
MLSTSDASRLMKTLSGQRMRIGTRHWVVKRSLVEQNRIRLELSGAPAVCIDFVLPESFDCRSGEHMAWLLAQVEEQLRATRG